MAIHLRAGLSNLRASSAPQSSKAAKALGAHLHRRFHKALVAYARATLRKGAADGMHLAVARHIALRKLGQRGAAEAKQLADIESESNTGRALLRQGVTKSLGDLASDWASPDARRT